ncbi:MAG: class I SAM-dependent methyltransferase [Bacteroidetes bacterium]|nr:class I SAM-dependent methyltransferase [Bacteroidota bacterium]MCB0513985.1 class I SAM-dependent methyltransferase [Bacteroidota bacterium]MCB9075027.1 class I SAM-dependent methyltransferase [Chitinophagales bacterium]
MFNKIKIFFRKLNWFIKNYKVLYDSSEIVYGPLTYNTDGLATRNNADFLKDEKFIKAYSKSYKTKSWEGFDIRWRAYIAYSFADLVKNIEGDFVECGVNKGGLSIGIIEYINFNQLNKTFYLLDTFQGYDEKYLSTDEKNLGLKEQYNMYVDCYDDVVNTFKEHPVKIIKGSVPETLTQCDTNKIAYLSIDMNCVLPEIEAIKYFWDKITIGGVIVLDDYGFPNHINQKDAHDELAKVLGYNIISLPTGQGIIIKNK